MISVIVPVYNGETTIKRCLESIIAQTFSNIEIIVIDDGSADKTAEAVKSIGDDRIILLRQENAGQGAARNAGLDAARGNYAAFVDADDTVEREMLEKMRHAAEKCGADVVQCNLTDIMPDGKTRVQLPDFEKTVIPGKDYMSRYMAADARHSFEVCNKLFRMDFIKENKLRFCDTKKYFSEDLLFNMELVPCLRKICFMKEPYYNYYQNENSHLRSANIARAEKIRLLFEHYIEKYPQMKEQAQYLGFVIGLWNIGACVKEDRAFAKEQLQSSFMRDCANAALLQNINFKHKIYALLAKMPLTRLKAAEIKYSR